MDMANIIWIWIFYLKLQPLHRPWSKIEEKKSPTILKTKIPLRFNWMWEATQMQIISYENQLFMQILQVHFITK